MIPLKEKDLKKVPLKKWKRMLKETYNIELLDIRAFLIGYEDEYINEADNGFLELSCFCERINQTSVDVSEEMYRVYILGEGENVKKRVTITLETEVEVSTGLSDEAVMRVAFPEIVLNERLSKKITHTDKDKIEFAISILKEIEDYEPWGDDQGDNLALVYRLIAHKRNELEKLKL